MSNQLTFNREPRVLLVGSLLILLGTTLLLDRFDVWYLRWDRLFWVVCALFGGVFMVDGYVRRGRGRVFWGSLLFFISLYYILMKWGLIERYGFYTMPALFLSLGFAFVMLYAFEPKEVALLIPAMLFVGIGVVSILWWWEVVEWYDIRRAIRTYWPVLLVLWGVILIFRRRPRRSPVV